MASVPFDQLDGFIWMNGEFVKWADAKIHVLTHGLHYASAVFEGERAYGGEIFKLTEHTERLHESARLLGFKTGRNKGPNHFVRRNHCANFSSPFSMQALSASSSVLN